ncbi:MAG: hypothetical protein L0K36_07310, partial [Lactiplantibacillus plantarum]|nr:hypothetical protein [Lactiplantibacillus plantarum]
GYADKFVQKFGLNLQSTFHWPLYVIFSHRMSNWVAAILTTGVSIGLSALSYYVLEPVIAGKPVHIFQCNVNWKKTLVANDGGHCAPRC